MSNAILTVHAGGTLRSRADLARIETPEPTRTWKPVSHRELVDGLLDGLRARDVRVEREQYATLGRGDTRLFGALDLHVPTFSDPDFGIALGLRASNDKSMAIEFIAAARVFVCDNMSFSGHGGAVCLRRKHTSGLDLGREIPDAVEEFLAKSDAFRLDLGRMREVGLSDTTAKELIHDSFAGPRPVLPVRLFPRVTGLYFEDEEQRGRFPDRTLWSLDNAFTEAVKALRPAHQHRAGRLIGRYFARALKGLLPGESN